MKRYHKRSFMVPFKFILIVQNNSEIFKSISYRYKFLVGARDPIDKIRQKFGFKALIHASSLMEGATAISRASLVGGHAGGTVGLGTTK